VFFDDKTFTQPALMGTACICIRIADNFDTNRLGLRPLLLPDSDFMSRLDPKELLPTGYFFVVIFLFVFLFSFDYSLTMYTVKTLPEFDTWLNGLKDRTTRLRLARRIDKAQRGTLGDVKPVGNGVVEMREHFGSGWRMYYTQRGSVLIVMLGGGDKSTQAADIATAVTLSATLED